MNPRCIICKKSLDVINLERFECAICKNSVCSDHIVTLSLDKCPDYLMDPVSENDTPGTWYVDIFTIYFCPHCVEEYETDYIQKNFKKEEWPTLIGQKWYSNALEKLLKGDDA